MKPMNDVILEGTFAATTYSDWVNCDPLWFFSVQSVFTVTAPANVTFVDADVNTTADTITKTAHGFATGLKVAASNAGGTLPGGLSATDYYVIVVNANTIKLATSVANALAGTAVDITTNAGGGTNTLTVAALTGASVKLQVSNDVPTDGTSPKDPVDLTTPAAVNITTAGSNVLEKETATTKWCRLALVIGAGQVTIRSRFNGKGV